MDSRISGDPASSKRRRRAGGRRQAALRDLRVQLALLSHRVGSHLDLKDVDTDRLDIIARHGPLSLTALARRAATPPP